jgi:hypothetical protein
MPWRLACEVTQVSMQTIAAHFLRTSYFLVLVGLLLCGGAPSTAPAAGLGTSSSVCASHYEKASARSAVDGKTLVGLRVQEQHTKFNITSVVSDFENSLNRGNAAVCRRQLANAADLWLNGTRANGCRDLMESTPQPTASTKPKLRNENVELLYSEARVTLDVFPSNEHHTYLLEDVHEKWVIKCFAKSPLK